MFASMAMSVEMVCEGSARFARYLVPSVLVVCVMSVAAPCAAQEVDAPYLLRLMQPMDVARSSCPAAFSGLVAPVRDRIALNVYGFYFGEVEVPVAQVDVPIRATSF